MNAPPLLTKLNDKASMSLLDGDKRHADDAMIQPDCPFSAGNDPIAVAQAQFPDHVNDMPLVGTLMHQQ